MLRIFAASSALALVLSAHALAQDHDHDGDSVTLYRVFVADHADPKVTAFDLGAPDKRWTFETTGQAKLYGVDDGAAVAAVQFQDDAVHFIRSGVELHGHGDHSDIEIEDPAVIEETLTGPRPFHLVDHDGHVAINFDRGGYAMVVDGHDLAEGEVEAMRVPQARAHHGFVAPVGDRWVTSVASDEPVESDAAPRRIGLQEIDEAGNPIGDVATCTGIHGEAFSGAYLAVGCKEGVLTVRDGPNGIVTEMLAFPDDLAEGETTGTLLGAKAMQVFLGNHGDSDVVVIDPVDEPHFRPVAFDFRRVDFVLDPAHAQYGYVLTEDGTLHRLDLLKAEIANSAKVTDPYSKDGDWNDPRPRLAMAGDEIVMSDPKAGLVRRIAKDTLEETGTIAVGGMPYNIAVVGGSGVVHDEAAEASETHGHDHASADHVHDHGDDRIYKGYFEDSQIKDRPLSDYAGDWQSVYPYLQDGTLDPVWAHKAEAGEMTAAEYADYYEIGYRTDVERITIEGDVVTFYKDGQPVAGQYSDDGFEVLTYKKGNRGVRFIFEKTAGDAAAPQYIQFSDHKIAPEKTDHYHLYWGDDRAALLEEVTNWPTYYPSSLDGAAIVAAMKAH